jgi:hypothetical protein
LSKGQCGGGQDTKPQAERNLAQRLSKESKIHERSLQRTLAIMIQDDTRTNEQTALHRYQNHEQLDMSTDHSKLSPEALEATALESSDIAFSRQELFEQAGLAALGLLDRDEHEAYERALRDQPAEVREQIIREQARFAESPELTARVEPDASLKDRVLDRVHAAIVQRVIHAESSEGSEKPERNLWRIGSVGLLAACVALGAIAFQTYQTNSDMRRQLESNAVATGSINIEAMLFDKNLTRIVLSANTDAGSAGVVSGAESTLFVNEQAKEARLLYRGLPRVEGSTYRVVVLDEQGSVTRELAQFEGTSQRDSIKMPSPEARSRVAVVLLPNGEISAGSKPKVLLSALV